MCSRKARSRLTTVSVCYFILQFILYGQSTGPTACVLCILSSTAYLRGIHHSSTQTTTLIEPNDSTCTSSRECVNADEESCESVWSQKCRTGNDNLTNIDDHHGMAWLGIRGKQLCSIANCNGLDPNMRKPFWKLVVRYTRFNSALSCFCQNKRVHTAEFSDLRNSCCTVAATMIIKRAAIPLYGLPYRECIGTKLWQRVQDIFLWRKPTNKEDEATEKRTTVSRVVHQKGSAYSMHHAARTMRCKFPLYRFMFTFLVSRLNITTGNWPRWQRPNKM